MKVIAVNTGEKRTVTWRGKPVQTGIYKTPVDSIFLEKEDVVNDHVIDRKYHGGIDKACYLFSAEAYPKFKAKYPQLDWHWGLFGENITIEGLDESQICIGDQYTIGSAIVEVSEPRQPCYKLGIRFGTQAVLKDFIVLEHSGVYVRVLHEGEVKSGDEMTLKSSVSNLSIRKVFKAIYQPKDHQEIIQTALKTPQLANSTKKDLKVFDE